MRSLGPAAGPCREEKRTDGSLVISAEEVALVWRANFASAIHRRSLQAAGRAATLAGMGFDLELGVGENGGSDQTGWHGGICKRICGGSSTRASAASCGWDGKEDAWWPCRGRREHQCVVSADSACAFYKTCTPGASLQTALWEIADWAYRSVLFAKTRKAFFFFPWMFFTLASSVVGSLVSVLLILMSISSLSSCSQKAGRRHKSQRKRQREAVKESTLGPYSPNGCLQIANTHHPCIFKKRTLGARRRRTRHVRVRRSRRSPNT